MSQTRPVEELFAELIELTSAAEREAYLKEACGDDQELLGQLTKLLAAHQQAGSFLADNASVDPTVDLTVADLAGTMIGPYKLRERLGSGGMGVVWAAERKKPIRQKVALKVIKPGMDSEQVVARFEAEREALALMDHPNIARVLDAGTTDQSRPYFVMELIHGVPITEYCNEHRLTVSQRLRLFVQVCKAVQHAHQKGIIHRDIKPSNVLVTEHDGSPVPKVIDFGVAKALHQPLTDRSIYTGVFQAIGTLAYMSPEQATLSGKGVDTRSDVYGLGVLLYELLTGTTPFDRETLEQAAFDEALRIIREEDAPKPSTRISTLGKHIETSQSHRVDARELGKLIVGDLDCIVLKSLEKDRSLRYETPSRLAEDVEHYLRDEPINARPPSARYQLGKFYSRHRSVVVSAAAVAVVLLLGVVTSTILAIKWRNQWVETQQAFDQLSSVAFQAALEALFLNSAAASDSIGLAEQAQVDPNWITFFQAFLHNQQGDAQQCIDDLDVLLQGQIDDDLRLSALSLMATAQIDVGNDPGYLRCMSLIERQLEQAPAAMWYEFIFLAMAQGEAHWAPALDSIGKSMTSRPTPIVLHMRAESLDFKALDTHEYEPLAQAELNNRFAREFIRDRADVDSQDAYIHRIGYELSRDENPEQAARHLRLLGEVVDELAQRLDFKKGVFHILNYYDCIDDYPKLIRVARDFHFADMVYIEYVAAHIFKRRGEQGRDDFDVLSFDEKNPYALIGRAHFLFGSGIDKNELIATYDAIISENADSPQVQQRALTLLALAHQPDRLRLESARIRKEFTGSLGLWAMDLSLEVIENPDRYSELVRKHEHSQMNLCAIHFAKGLVEFAKGNRSDKAREAFQKCADTRFVYFFEWAWADAYVEQYRQDPNWGHEPVTE